MENPCAHDDVSACTAAAGSKNISVFCRLKPQSSSDKTLSSFAVEDEKTIRIKYPIASSPPLDQGHKTGTTKASLAFTFDRVYDETSSQKLIFEGVGKPLVEAVCSGLNATVLAYGTTASGKTYTILGPRTAPASRKTCTTVGARGAPSSKRQSWLAVEPSSQQVGVQRGVSVFGNSRLSTDENKDWQCRKAGLSAYDCQEEVGGERSEDGLLPRMIFYMYDCLGRKTNVLGRTVVKAAAMEVYNDSIVDLVTGKRGLKIHKPKMGQVSIVGLHEEVLLGPEAAVAFLERVVDERKTAATNVNAESSRSHFVFWLILQETTSAAGLSTTARLSVVDLAGSERLVKTNTCGGTQVEGAMINKSLTCLGKVINCLALLNEAHGDHASGAAEGYGEAPCSTQQCRTPHFIPYRDSKLTRLLQDSLGGNSHTSIVLTCSQQVTHLAENISTLRFGQRARNVKNSPKVNEEAGHGNCEVQKDISRYQNYIRELASWGETAIVKLTDRTRSATEKLCGSQNIPVLRKTGGSSRRVGLKRANTSTPGFVKERDDDERQAEVVDELLSGFPPPPKALQLDYIKDDVALNIRHRLQHELVYNRRVDESEAITCKPDSVPAFSVLTEFARYGGDDFQIATFDVYPHSVGRTTDTALPPGQRLIPLRLKQQGDSDAMDKESVQRNCEGSRQVNVTSSGSQQVTPTTSTTHCCNIHPESVKNGEAYSSSSSATQEANKTAAKRASCTGNIFQQRGDVISPQRPDLSLCQTQDGNGRTLSLGLSSAYSRMHPGVEPLEPIPVAGRENTTRHVTPPRAHRACPEIINHARVVARLKLPAFWEPATSWVSHIKGLQDLFPGRAGRLEGLRRATQRDDIIRLKQRLLL